MLILYYATDTVCGTSMDDFEVLYLDSLGFPQVFLRVRDGYVDLNPIPITAALAEWSLGDGHATPALSISYHSDYHNELHTTHNDRLSRRNFERRQLLVTIIRTTESHYNWYRLMGR